MGVEHAARRCDHVGLGEAVDNILGRELMLEHAGRVQSHDELAIFSSYHLDPFRARDSMKARDHVIECDIRQFRETSSPGAQARINDWKSRSGEKTRLNRGPLRQPALGVCDRRVHELKGVGYVGGLSESNVDFGAAAGGGRAHQGHAVDTVGGAFQHPRHRDQHLFRGEIAAVRHYNHAVELHLRKYRARNAQGQNRPENAGRDNRQNGERVVGACHDGAPAIRILSPSESAYPPEVMTWSPALIPSNTWTLGPSRTPSVTFTR